MLNILKKCEQVLALRPQMKEALQAQLQGTPSHALLFIGSSGSGKTSLAQVWAFSLLLGGRRLLNAQDVGHEQLKYLLEGVHPDYYHIQKEENESTIKMERLRRLLEEEVQMGPQVSKLKVWVIEVDDLSEISQNILLKTIEEAPSYAYFVLLSSAYQRVLPTVRSRCISYTLPKLSNDSLRKVIEMEWENQEKGALQRERLSVLLPMAAGNPGLALSLLEDEEHWEQRCKLLAFLCKIHELSVAEVLLQGTDLFTYYKKDFSLLNQCLQSYFHDMSCLYLMNTQAKMHLFHQDFFESFQKQKENLQMNMQHWKFLQAVLDEAISGLEANANFELTSTYLLLQLKRSLRPKRK